jgi:hypothetical protein
MTRDEFKRQRQTYSKQAHAALVCGAAKRSIEIAIESARFVLAHPECWPDDADPDWIRRQCEDAIRMGQGTLDLTRGIEHA